MKVCIILVFSFFSAISAQGQICLGYGPDGRCIGISLDGLPDDERQITGIQLCVAPGDSRCNGLSVGLVPSGSVNGLSTGLLFYLDKINGLAVGGFVGGLGYVAPPENQIGSLNGVAISITCSIGVVNGISVGSFNVSKTQHGIMVGGFNLTSELHGLQIGMLNYAGNNPKLLRYLPLLNVHF